MKSKDTEDHRVNWVDKLKIYYERDVWKIHSVVEFCSNKTFAWHCPTDLKTLILCMYLSGAVASRWKTPIENPKTPNPDWDGGSGGFPRGWEAGWKGGWRDRQKGHCPHKGPDLCEPGLSSPFLCSLHIHWGYKGSGHLQPSRCYRASQLARLSAHTAEAMLGPILGLRTPSLSCGGDSHRN